MTGEQKKPTMKDMREYIDKILVPLGQMPDKTNMNYEQVREFYSDLAAADRTFKDLVQVAIFKRDVESEKK
ncbi:MAG: hypothetical protein KGH89_09115 [Thaumarchaeota archaeon]|nr:hypothetical protein [Nitrososphaerota archaeon]MDE1867326.1 hypothetical protein [Nitrososphaerota archaeon]